MLIGLTRQWCLDLHRLPRGYDHPKLVALDYEAMAGVAADYGLAVVGAVGGGILGALGGSCVGLSVVLGRRLAAR